MQINARAKDGDGAPKKICVGAKVHGVLSHEPMLEHALPVVVRAIKIGNVKHVMEQENITIQQSSAMHAKGAEPIPMPRNNALNVEAQDFVMMFFASSVKGVAFLSQRKRLSAENVQVVEILKRQKLWNVKDVMELAISIQNVISVVGQDTTLLDKIKIKI
ncbi:MAG: hypothetical protein R8J85_10185 [Mariprofundales bacterium]